MAVCKIIETGSHPNLVQISNIRRMDNNTFLLLCLHVRSPGKILALSARETKALTLLVNACGQSPKGQNPGLGMEIEMKDDIPIEEMKISRQQWIDMKNPADDFDFTSPTSGGGLFVVGSWIESDVMSEEQKEICSKSHLGYLRFYFFREGSAERQSEEFNILCVAPSERDLCRDKLVYK